MDDIPGIGATRRKALMKYFDSIEEVRNASEETLAGIDSMDARSARSVYEFFHKEDQEEDLQNSSSKESTGLLKQRFFYDMMNRVMGKNW